MLATWCQHRLGARPVETVFRAGHLSLVVGLRLADGQRVVVKVRSPARRVHGCVAVQRALAAAGFPCPRPLAGPDALAGALVTAEELVPGGEPLADGAEAAERLAGLLAELVAAAPPVAAVPSLRPAPPWVGWDHDEPRLWPAPDDLDEDLNDHPGPEWLDRAAVRVRARLAGLGLPSVVGHGDWESQNVRWRGGQAVAVHDWDSVVAQPEAAIAGQAAAVWPVAGPPGEAASVEQTDRFLAAYERSRGRPWTGVEREVAWAAGLWVRAFNAKKETVAGGGPQLGRLAGEVAERSRNAGI